MVMQDYTVVGVDASATGTSLIGHVQIHKPVSSAVVEKIVAEAVGGADADFQVILDGENVFESAQSLDSADTPEVLTPDQNQMASGDIVPLAVEVTSAGAADDTLNVSVLVDDNRK